MLAMYGAVSCTHLAQHMLESVNDGIDNEIAVIIVRINVVVDGVVILSSLLLTVLIWLLLSL